MCLAFAPVNQRMWRVLSSLFHRHLYLLDNHLRPTHPHGKYSSSRTGSVFRGRSSTSMLGHAASTGPTTSIISLSGTRKEMDGISVEVIPL